LLYDVKVFESIEITFGKWFSDSLICHLFHKIEGKFKNKLSFDKETSESLKSNFFEFVPEDQFLPFSSAERLPIV